MKYFLLLLFNVAIYGNVQAGKKIKKILPGSHNTAVSKEEFEIQQTLPEGFVEDETTCFPEVGYGVNPYSKNYSRSVNDIELWAGVGPLKFERFFNSGGYINGARFSKPPYASYITPEYATGNWNHSYKYYLGEDTFKYKWLNNKWVADSLRAAIQEPDGTGYLFRRSITGTWVNNDEERGANFTQIGSRYILQKADGYRYHFFRYKKSRPNPQPDTVWFKLEEILDPYDNKFSISYTNDKLDTIKDPSGRWIAVNYSAYKDTARIKSVTTSDGRSITYNYRAVAPGGYELSGVTYDDGTQATYSADGHFVDPRLNGDVPTLKYTGSSGARIYNGKTNEPMVWLNTKNLDNNNPNAKEATVNYSNGRKQVFNMSNSKIVKSYTDGLGSKTDYEYNTNNYDKVLFVKKTTDALGRSISYTERTPIYGNPLTITYPDILQTKETWERNDLDLMTMYKNRAGQVTKYNRNPTRHWIDSIHYGVDGSSETFKDYTDFGQFGKHRLRNGGIEHFVYENTLLKSKRFEDTQQDPELKATPYTINYGYNALNQLETVTSPRPGNFITKYEYNKRGLVTKIINPIGSTGETFQKYDYDDFGNTKAFTSELGKTWTTEYDEFNRPTKFFSPITGRPATIYSYNLPGAICACTYTEAKPTLITLPTGRKTEIEYDVEWRKIRETAGKGTADEATTRYIPDKVGRPVWTIDPKGRRWKKDFDIMDRIEKEQSPIPNLSASITQYRYDNLDRITHVLRNDGKNIVNYEYDDINHILITRVIDFGNSPYVTKSKFDTEGNMVRFADANMVGKQIDNDDTKVHQFKYDQLNRLRKRIYPVSNGNQLNEKYQYDAAGNLISYENRAGNIKTFTYDERNQLKTTKWDDNITPEVTYEYDDANRLKSITTSEAGKIIYQYNDANELVSESQDLLQGDSMVVGYTYNADGLRDIMKYPSGYIVKYNYNGRNQISAIDEVIQGVRLVEYQYDLNGNCKCKSLSNNTHVAYAYDEANQVTKVEHKSGSCSSNTSGARLLNTVPECDSSSDRFDYGYDNLNRVKYIQRNLYKGDVFSYDALGQITEVKYNVLNPDGNPGSPDSVASYNWDPVGNRRSVTKSVFNLTKGIPGVNAASANLNTIYETNNLNQYIKIDGEDLLYTLNGNLTAWKEWVFTYDAEDRLIKAEKEVDGRPFYIKFFYDALDRCVRRDVNGKVTTLYYDGQQLIEELDIYNRLIARYTYGAEPGELLILYTPPANTNFPVHTVYYHYEKDGSVTKLSDGQGNTVETYDYDWISGSPYIRPAGEAPSPVSKFGNRFMFQGAELISYIVPNRSTALSLGPMLYNFNGRMYSVDDELGRFLQANPRDVNSYLYANNSPINDGNGEDNALNEELPGFGASLIPVYGSVKSMGVHLRHGNYWTGAGYALLALSDAFLVGTIVKAVGKVGGKLAVSAGTKMIAGGKSLLRKGVLLAALARQPEGLAFKIGTETLAEIVQKGAFLTFKDFKAYYGPAGRGMAWHHIVEQTRRNIIRFGSEEIHNIQNLIRLPHGAGTIHARVSGFYSSIQPFTGGQTVRQWLSRQNRLEQYIYGTNILKRFGWKP